MSLLGNVTWTVSNLCRGKPAPPIEQIAPAVPCMANLLRENVPVEVLVDAVWALSYVSDGPNERIEMIMDTNVIRSLIGFLSDKESPLLTPTIRCLGNFVTGSDEQTQMVMDANIVDHLEDLLESSRKTIRKETCWLASNITAGTQNQIAMLMHKRGILHSLIDNAMNSSWEIRKEAIWALSNICTTGDDVQVMGLIQFEGLQPLTEVLAFHNADATVLVAALDAIEQVLLVGDRHGKDYCNLLDEYNGIDNLENLQEHPSTSVYEKTVHIIETYFGAEEQEDENLAPTLTDSGTFGFGLSSPKQLFPTGGSTAAPVFQFGISNRAF
jgi:importin subunit alpha-1